MLELAAAFALAVQLPSSTEQVGQAADGRLYTEVTIEGRGPWRFILDTGASHTAVADVLAAQFGYVPTGDLSNVQTLTEEIRSERLTLARVEALGLTAEAIEAVVVETPTDLDLQLYGLLGADMFDRRTVALDFAAARFDGRASAPRFTDARLDEARRVPVGEAHVDGVREPVAMMIDTGSPRTIINSALERRVRERGVRVNFDVMGATRLARRERNAPGAMLEAFRVGGVCGVDMVVAHADVDVFRALGWRNRPAMIVGVDALQSAVLTLDYDSGRVEISPAQGSRCES